MKFVICCFTCGPILAQIILNLFQTKVDLKNPDNVRQIPHVVQQFFMVTNLVKRATKIKSVIGMYNRTNDLCPTSFTSVRRC